uniref:Uncharacterized protein n=1 Tax=viral metagenome TaxID=1070528 RepID=A0A6C0E5S6_9ZZZZ
MDALSNLVRRCLKDEMGFMIESYQYANKKEGVESDLLQNNFRYHPENDKVNYIVRSYFNGSISDETLDLDEALQNLMVLLEDHCLTYQKLEEFHNSAPANNRKAQQLDLIYDEDGLKREILAKAPIFHDSFLKDASLEIKQTIEVKFKKEKEEFLADKKKFLSIIERMVTNIRKMKIEFQNSLNP